MANNFHELSLVAKFDDLVRNGRVLHQGIEGEFLEFATGQLQLMAKWNGEKPYNEQMENELANLRSQNQSLDTKLKHARKAITEESRKRKMIEDEKNTVEHHIHVIRQIIGQNQTLQNDQDLRGLPFLSTDFGHDKKYDHSPHGRRSHRKNRSNLQPIDEQNSHSILSDISYDKTGDDDLLESQQMDESRLRSGHVWKMSRPSAPTEEGQDPTTLPHRPRGRHRRSKSGENKRPRRHRRSNSATIVKTNVSVMDDGQVHAEAEICGNNGRRQRIVSPRRSMKKAFSAGNMTTEDIDEAARQSPQALIQQLNNQVFSPGSPLGLRRVLSGGLNRAHRLVEKCFLKGEHCIPCGKKISFGKYAMKCRDCRACVHTEHKDDLPLPCIPTVSTPGMTKNTGLLSDYTPVDPPMVPALVIHCVREIELRGLTEKGIYRVSGSVQEIRDLKEKFMKNKGAPALTAVNDVHVVCGCLKDFLRSLKEPVLTYSLWDEFAAAQNASDEEAEQILMQAVSRLPQPNRDTLAYLMVHLQSVAESHACEMKAGNLSVVFGPCLMGTPPATVDDHTTIFRQTQVSNNIVERLINLSSDYWHNFISVVHDDWASQATHIGTSTPQTPERRPCDYESILGPIGTPNSKVDMSTTQKGWLTTPRFGGSRARTVAGKKSNHFFASPTLK